MANKTREWLFPNLEELLWENHISISDLADQMGMERSAIYKKMTGDHKWSLDEIKSVSKILNRANKGRKKLTIDFIFKEAKHGNKE